MVMACPRCGGCLLNNYGERECVNCGYCGQTLTPGEVNAILTRSIPFQRYERENNIGGVDMVKLNIAIDTAEGVAKVVKSGSKSVGKVAKSVAKATGKAAKSTAKTAKKASSKAKKRAASMPRGKNGQFKKRSKR